MIFQGDPTKSYDGFTDMMGSQLYILVGKSRASYLSFMPKKGPQKSGVTLDLYFEHTYYNLRIENCSLGSIGDYSCLS